MIINGKEYKTVGDLTENEREFLRSYDQASEWGKKKIRKLVFLLLNESPRIKKLLELKESGKISQTEFLMRI